MVNLSDESKRFIGNENSIKRCLRRFSAISIQKIDDILLEETHWNMIDKENSKSFLFYDNKNNKNRIIIFSSETYIGVLKRTKIIYVDGTLSLAPPNFTKFIYYTRV